MTIFAKHTNQSSMGNGNYLTQNSISPLSSRWDSDRNILQRYYPDKRISETDFIRKAGRYLGLKDADNELRLHSERSIHDITHRRYRQYYKGIPVLHGELVMNLDREGYISGVFNNIYPIMDFIIDERLISDEGRAAISSEIDLNDLRGELSHDLYIAETAESYKLVYRWLIPANSPLGDWEILVDAAAGAILSKQDLRRFSVNGHGRVFIPDPKTAIESNALVDNNDMNSAIPLECYSDTVLLELDDTIGGFYYLDGAYASTAPTANRAQESSPEFYYYRQDDRFEEVNTYYHLDTYQRYIQSLGFYDIVNRPQECNVNGTSEDNSWFSPMTGVITFGFGGVDDAEDADVIIHEYGHAIQWDILPGWSGGHTGAMGEGFGDYIAGTYSLTINPDFHPEWVFTWDGHNQFWAGRWLNMPYHYPENAGSEIHDAGQLWSAGLIDVWYDVPNVEIWDMIVFQHHYYLGNGATMEDAANAILLADININEAAYRQIIIGNFAERGFIEPAYFSPIITHEPLCDTEDTLASAFTITAEITSGQPLDSASLLLYWGLDGEITEESPLQFAGGDTFSAAIPGPFNQQTISYFISAADIYGCLTTHPPDAPAELHQFYVGPDTIPPEITVVDTLQNTVFQHGFGIANILVTDNLGIDSVKGYCYCEGSQPVEFELNNTEGDTFTAFISWGNLQNGQRFYYWFSAEDASNAGNVRETREYSFIKTTNSIFDDFEGTLLNWESSNAWDIQNLHYYSSSHSAHDRENAGINLSTEFIMSLKNPWNTHDLSMLNLEYYAKYFMIPLGDSGWVEVKTPSSGWEQLDYVEGVEPQWIQRTISLEDYLDVDSLYIRFRSVVDTAGYASNMGWFIDDIYLTTDQIVGIDDDENVVPRNITLSPVTPNPFNNSTIIPLYLHRELPVNIIVYNQLGQRVITLIDERLQPGQHIIRWNADDLASGMYLINITADDFNQTTKVILIK